eukprot:TRINITY_DN11407_c0_g1_i1.p2 TRINITY_DN11407_c0_g1~~TRINITY_DN11407_c0_g1_i1.p2  ORF type:complete len:115 (-),score=33.89 TRINITY_DN11407_c0_g1_i1:74-418(-)
MGRRRRRSSYESSTLSSTSDSSKISLPERPKRARTAWTYFIKDKTSDYKEEFPKMAERSKQMSKDWRAMSAKKKEKYENLAEKDTKRYKKEMKKYNVIAEDFWNFRQKLARRRS